MTRSSWRTRPQRHLRRTRFCRSPRNDDQRSLRQEAGSAPISRAEFPRMSSRELAPHNEHGTRSHSARHSRGAGLPWAGNVQEQHARRQDNQTSMWRGSVVIMPLDARPCDATSIAAMPGSPSARWRSALREQLSPCLDFARAPLTSVRSVIANVSVLRSRNRRCSRNPMRAGSCLAALLSADS